MQLTGVLLRIARLRYLIQISAAAHVSVRTPLPDLRHTAGMKTTVMNPVKAFTLVALGLAIAAMGFYVADADDAPGAAAIGMLLMVVGVVLGVRAARNRLPTWAARTALAVGVVVAAVAAFLTHDLGVTAPLFPQSQEVPSVVDSTPAPQYAAAVERARELVRATVLEQNLPGVSVAVGAGSLWHHRLGRRLRMEGRRDAGARHAGHAIQHRHGGVRGRRRRRAARAEKYRG